MIRRDDLPYWLLLGAGVAALSMLASNASAEQFIPPACVELAVREGYPLPQTNVEIVAARVRLWAMSRRDPLVRECRKAIDRLKAEAKR